MTKRVGVKEERGSGRGGGGGDVKVPFVLVIGAILSEIGDSGKYIALFVFSDPLSKPSMILLARQGRV